MHETSTPACHTIFLKTEDADALRLVGRQAPAARHQLVEVHAIGRRINRDDEPSRLVQAEK